MVPKELTPTDEWREELWEACIAIAIIDNIDDPADVDRTRRDTDTGIHATVIECEFERQADALIEAGKLPAINWCCYDLARDLARARLKELEKANAI